MNTTGLYTAIFAAFGAAGLLVLYSHRKLIRLAISSYRWLSTEAIVVDSADTSFSMTGMDRYTSVGTVTYRETTHVFQYEVAGQIYRTNRYCFGAHVEQAGASFLIGTKVRVFYDPKNPQSAVVKRGLQPSMFLGPLLIASALFVIGRLLFSGGAP